MKIRFEADQDFQNEAIESVVGVFKGQEILQTQFTIASWRPPAPPPISGIENNLCIRNDLKLRDEDIHKNIRKIQLKKWISSC